jgi:chromosome segregation protein
VRAVRSELTGLRERLHNDQVRELEIRSEMDRLRERILQEFRVDLSEEARRAPEEGAELTAEAGGEPEDEERQRLQIADLRQQLLKLGPVNFLAAEEYARQKERLLFHRKQQEDLRKARQDLLDAIQQINETAGKMFKETFALARVHFQRTFESLFPGGEADLSLDGEDPLEGSIEIKARPRGKKLEAMRLLSTGERALTAIALLFGIYLVKPSPFCILDELDAPLDDANIDRFVGMLRHFSEKTQFVVITHNKRTMEAADRLFGVTMQTVGISKIVSVRLTDADWELSAEAAEVLQASGQEREGN